MVRAAGTTGLKVPCSVTPRYWLRWTRQSARP